MPLVNMKDMLEHAYQHNYAVGAFDLVNLEFLQGILAAAERCRAPVILSLAESHFEYFDFDLLMSAVETAAQRASVPVSIHLDHGRDLLSAVRAINKGCNGVMVDASSQEFAENLRITREVVEMAHGCGVPVEGELGYVPGVAGEDTDCRPNDVVYTTVAEARAYVERTGVDCLAVSIGTVRGRMKAKPKLDWQRLKQINEALDIPLVINGGAGLNDSQFRRLIANGVAKINYYTALADVARDRLRTSGKGNGNSSYAAVMHGVQDAVGQEAERCMRQWGAAGRAAEVLAQCSHWLPVEHVIIYNADGLEETSVEAVMAEARRVLSAIPGVREIRSGEAVYDDASYKYSWLVRFCHPAAIDSYRKHPAHVAFTNQRFWPMAGQRISTDYRILGQAQKDAGVRRLHHGLAPAPDRTENRLGNGLLERCGG